MFEKIQSTLKSREFQTDAGHVAIAITAIIVANVASSLVARGLNNGLESLMDKVHGKIEVKPAE